MSEKFNNNNCLKWERNVFVVVERKYTVTFWSSATCFFFEFLSFFFWFFYKPIVPLTKFLRSIYVGVMTHKSNKDCQVHAASVLWLVSSRFCFFRNSQKSITDTHTHLLFYRFLKQTYYSCPKMKGRNCPQCGKVSTLCCTRAVHLLIFT